MQSERLRAVIKTAPTDSRRREFSFRYTSSPETHWRQNMRRLAHTLLVIFALTPSAAVVAQTKRQDESQKPLVLASQGSFFVGGATRALPTGGDITINQMYVQYQTPVNGDQHVPVVMVHGCCLSSKTWETTPDGRMGWNEYFVR